MTERAHGVYEVEGCCRAHCGGDPVSSFTRVEERDLHEVFEVGLWLGGWNGFQLHALVLM